MLFIRQKNECEDQGEGVQNSGKISTGVRGRDIGIEEGTGNWRSQKYECYTIDVRSYETVQDRKWKNVRGQRNWAKLQRKSKKIC